MSADRQVRSQCRATTATGMSCRRTVASANGYCVAHRGRLWLVHSTSRVTC